MTKERLAVLFNEWMSRYIDDPAQRITDEEMIDRFLAESVSGTPTYGDRCAAHLLLLDQQVDA